jgi:hypothetical protein
MIVILFHQWSFGNLLRLSHPLLRTQSLLCQLVLILLLCAAHVIQVYRGTLILLNVSLARSFLKPFDHKLPATVVIDIRTASEIFAVSIILIYGYLYSCCFTSGNLGYQGRSVPIPLHKRVIQLNFFHADLPNLQITLY